MKLSLIQMNSAGDRDSNVAKALALIDRAATEYPDLIVLPEFFNTYYFAEDFDRARFALAEPRDGTTIHAIRDAARQHHTHIAATIYEIAAPGVYFDTTFLADPSGDADVLYRKTHPAAVNSVEKLYFQAGTSYGHAQINGINVGCIICYDTSFPESMRCSVLNGAELIIIPFAAPVANKELWTAQKRTRAVENGAYVAPCNKFGKERTWVFGGGSMIVSPRGEVLAEAPDDDAIISAEIDRDEVVAARVRMPTFRDRRPDLYTPITTYMDRLPHSGGSVSSRTEVAREAEPLPSPAL
jgi:N-carbamoylputrescine amidase